LLLLLSPLIVAGVVAGVGVVLDLVWWITVPGACMAFLVVGLGMGALLAPLLADEEAGLDEAYGDREERAFFEIGNVALLAEEVGPLFWEKETWIQRRVEQIRFVDRTMVRRQISIDFRVPAQGLSNDGVTYLPISVLRSWPPVLNFSLRDADGRPMSLLSKKATNTLDERVLMGLAEHAMDARAEEIAPYVRRIINDEGRRARRAFTILRDAIEGIAEEGIGETDVYAQLVDLAAVMVDSTMLWIPAPGDPESRHIIKLSYDEPIVRRLLLGRRLLTALSWRSIVIAFDVPHVGDANSYHLEIEPPEPLEMRRSQLVLASDPSPGSLRQRLREQALATVERARVRIAFALELPLPSSTPIDTTRNAQLLTRRTHLYASGDRAKGDALASVRLDVPRAGTLTAAVVVGWLVAGAMYALDYLRADILAARSGGHPPSYSAAVGFLLLAPPLLAYILLRSSEHPLTSRLLVGIRAMSVGCILISVLSAALLIAAGATDDPGLLDRWTPWLWRSATMIACVLTFSWLLPLRRAAQRND
jgi:hypothetical protein